MAVELTAQKLDTAGALARLRVRYPDLRADTFYHRVLRDQIAHETVRVGETNRYLFAPGDLDAVEFKRPSRAASSYLSRYNHAPPVEVHSAQDLDKLRREFGDLVDDEGLRSAILREHGITYSAGALKQRLLRHTIFVAGYSGGKRKQRWYPVKQIKYLRFQQSKSRA